MVKGDGWTIVELSFLDFFNYVMLNVQNIVGCAFFNGYDNDRLVFVWEFGQSRSRTRLIIFQNEFLILFYF